MLCTTVISTFAIYHYFTFQFINGTLAKLSKACKIMVDLNLNNNFKLNETISLLLKRIHLIHCYICFYEQYSFSELWSIAMFAFIIGGLPFHVICVISLTQNMILELRILLIIILIIISIMIIVDLMLLAWKTETIHQSKKYLVPIIQWIKFNDDWNFKFQCANWFYRMTCGPKSGPFVFLIGHLTYDTVFNVSGI